ncbi:uncharacterized protein AB675_2158 [Cyphellophora attinorum]|uniref:Uncharacterized protein n=1 Tax=Cyphellophora attinorum TaxID=1664694 RepID=A0A0N1HUC4_9EURO|nr:uncharacterized protein AB675_2158 [Phialophora attinorum]KPI42956.1 hypothetical protein AB675_2158 [Phialophora attinorum]
MNNVPGVAGHQQPAAAGVPLFMPPYPTLAPLPPPAAPQQPPHLLPPHLQYYQLPPLYQEPMVFLDRDTYQILVEALARARDANGADWGARDFEDFHIEIEYAYNRLVGMSAVFDVPGQDTIAEMAEDRATRIENAGARRQNAAIAEQQQVKAKEAVDEYLRIVHANGNAEASAESIERMQRLLFEARYRSDVAAWYNKLEREPVEQLRQRRRLEEQQQDARQLAQSEASVQRDLARAFDQQP